MIGVSSLHLALPGTVIVLGYKRRILLTLDVLWGLILINQFVLTKEKVIASHVFVHTVLMDSLTDDFRWVVPTDKHTVSLLYRCHSAPTNAWCIYSTVLMLCSECSNASNINKNSGITIISCKYSFVDSRDEDTSELVATPLVFPYVITRTDALVNVVLVLTLLVVEWTLRCSCSNVSWVEDKVLSLLVSLILGWISLSACECLEGRVHV